MDHKQVRRELNAIALQQADCLERLIKLRDAVDRETLLRASWAARLPAAIKRQFVEGANWWSHYFYGNPLTPSQTTAVEQEADRRLAEASEKLLRVIRIEDEPTPPPSA